MRYSIHSMLRSTALLLLVGVIFLGCNEIPTVPEEAPTNASPQFLGKADVEEIIVFDPCEPNSFNAAIGPGTCVGDGEVTFGEFLEQLNPEDGGHEDWFFDPDDTDIDEGETLRAINEGGEEHTFTEVVSFGAGFVPPLNAALPPGTPDAVLAEPLGPTFVPAGGTRTLAGLSVGTHRFQCLIHPWMRSVVEVEADEDEDEDDGLESEADLDGSQEVPAVVTAMTGEVEVEIEDGELEFELEVENNTNDIFAAHIHCAPPGVNGPVGVTLFVGSFTAAEGTLAEGTIAAPDAGNGCGWASIADVAADLAAGNTYVNVHTTPASGGVPSGEIRGNLPGDDDD